MLKHIYILIGLLIVSPIFSQENSVTGPDLTICEGFLVDSGMSAADYGNNENATITICPEAPETIVNLYFSFFDIGTGDTMWIYDGDSEAAPLIGEYVLGELQGLDITSTDGCLTIHWETDASDVGSFGAQISCGLPCLRPIAHVDLMDEIPILVCAGDEITFDASASEFPGGVGLDSWEWVFNDGETNNADWPVTTHSFDEPGDYKVQLFLTDSLECSNNNLVDVLVLVSTEATFEGTTGDLQLCLGQEVGLDGVIQSPTWTGLPDINFGGALFIPDDQTECFESEIVFNTFDPGTTIEEIGDLDNFYINFEHSFMGDLVITFICPNNQSIAVHQQGGGATLLGVPIDIDADLNPGIGWDYWWSPDAVLGTWEDESGGTLPSGIYDSTQPWENLIGCPLNGTWTVEICDMWGSDNGFIFDWTVEFDPSLYPELITFTPTFGAECDSTFWTGPYITDDGGNCTNVMIEPTEAGIFDYTFSAVNNHGCEYEVPIQVEVTELFADAGDDQTYCLDDIFLNGQAINDEAPWNNIVYSWDPAGNLSNGNISNPQVTTLSETTDFTLTIFPLGAEECAASDEMTVTILEVDPFVAETNEPISDCPGDEVTLTVFVEGGNPEYDYEWFNNDDDDTTTASPQQTTDYDVVITDQCGLEIIETITVVVNDPGTEITADDVKVCIGGSSLIENISGGDGNYSFVYAEDSLLVTFVGNASGTIPGVYEVEIYDGCHAFGTIDVTVEVCEVEVYNVFTPGVSGGMNDVFEIKGSRGFLGSTLEVYNRWGTLIYETTNTTSAPILSWDGEEYPEGTYYYIIDLEGTNILMTINGNEMISGEGIVSGTFTLLR